MHFIAFSINSTPEDVEGYVIASKNCDEPASVPNIV
jgi:hypothetical protein